MPVLPLPRFFEASKPLQPFEFQVDFSNDQYVADVLAASALAGTTAFIVASTPTLVTTTILAHFTYGVVEVTVTSTVAPAVGTAIASGAATAGIALVVLALGYIQKAKAEAQKQRDLAKQRDTVNTLNTQIENLTNQEKELNNRLNQHLIDQNKALNEKILESKINLNISKHQTSYIVKSGDTLSKISRKFGVPVEILISNNSFRSNNPDLIYPGEQMFIPANTVLKTNKSNANSSIPGKVLSNAALAPSYVWSRPETEKLPKELTLPLLTATTYHVSVLPENRPSTVEIVEYYSIDKRIELINNSLNSFVQDEELIIDLINNVPKSDTKQFLNKLKNSGLLPRLESSLNFGNYAEYHKILYTKWMESFSPEELGELLERSIKNLDKNLSVKEATKKNIFFWKDPGIFRELVESEQRIYYDNYFTNEGKSYNINHHSPGGIFSSGRWGTISKEPIDPFDPIVVYFNTTPEAFDATKTQIKIMPAISLEALRNEQVNKDIYFALNVVSLAIPFFAPANLSKVSIALLTLLNTTNLLTQSYRDLIIETDNGKEMLHYLDAINIMTALYDIGTVVKSSPNLVKNFTKYFKEFKKSNTNSEIDKFLGDSENLNKTLDDLINNIYDEMDSPFHPLNQSTRIFGDKLFVEAVDNINILRAEGKLLDIGNASDLELAAIHRYTINGNLSNIPRRGQNYAGHIEFEDLIEIDKQIFNAHNKLSKTKRLVKDEFVFRGRTYSMDEYNKIFNSGAIEIPIEGFVSTTKDIKAAIDFTSKTGKGINNKVKVIFKINSQNGVYIDDISDWGKNFVKKNHPGEMAQEEVLLLEGYYKIVSPPKPFLENSIPKIDSDGTKWIEIELFELQKPLN